FGSGPNNQAAPFVGPVGFVATPSVGATLISVMRIYNANDATERDPINYVLQGSLDGVSWTTISSGALDPSTVRIAGGATALDPLAMYSTSAIQEIHFANSGVYFQYRWSVNDVRTDSTANRMQLAEVELLGGGGSLAPVLTRQPTASSSVFGGASPNASLPPFGSRTPAYKWYKSGAAISGATLNNYTLANAQLTDSGATFYCRVSSSGGTVNSATNPLTVGVRPTNGYPVAVMADNPIAYWRLSEGPD